MSKRNHKRRGTRQTNVATAKVEPKDKKHAMGFWLLQMLIVAGSAIALYRMVDVGASDNKPELAKSHVQADAPIGSMNILVVDTQRLMQAQINQAQQQIARGAQFNQDQLEMKGKIFGTEMLRAVKKYRDQGFLVMDRRNALAVPKEMDITEELARTMKLKLPEYTDPFSAPALSD